MLLTRDKHRDMLLSKDAPWGARKGSSGKHMVRLVPWLERRWSFDLPVGAFPVVLERLRGTPARANQLVAGVPEAVLAARPMGKWSVKEHLEHLGHLNDLHGLDVRRVKEFLSGAKVLTAADMANRRTEEGRHGAAPITDLLRTFRPERHELIVLLENLTERDVAATAFHPRLGMSVRLVDWAQFVAEHDDHHLARRSTRFAH
jgi:hypothetical protein